MKLLIGLAFIGVIGSLASALVLMMRRGPDDPGQGDTKDDTKRAKRMVMALAIRVGLSVLLLVGVLIAWKLGYLHPSGLPADH
ncbi:DUF2909 domain-containing protein [Ottowia sp.]|uniref:DUF2909 domain-containing protein n=1 Tax=Ottowia sp. TaxID=1898956 RepID=UPI003A866DBA